MNLQLTALNEMYMYGLAAMQHMHMYMEVIWDSWYLVNPNQKAFVADAAIDFLGANHSQNSYQSSLVSARP